MRFKTSQTIDQQQMILLKEERQMWENVQLYSLLLSGLLDLEDPQTNSIFSDNGHFLKEVELLAKFDLVMREHLTKIKDGSTHTHTHTTWINTYKITDCTPDISHQERCLSLYALWIYEIKEYFLGFLVVKETTGKNLETVILNRTFRLNLWIVEVSHMTMVLT